MTLGQLDLNQLIALEALLSERHVSRAGERVGLSPSAMSKSLRRLRVAFRDPLLVRSGHEYALTSFAEGLLDPVRDILRLIDGLEQRPEFDEHTDRRLFRIAAHDGTAFLLLRPLMEKILVEAPRISLSVEPLAGRQTVELIDSGEIDLALWSTGNIESHLEQQPLYQDRMIAAVWKHREDVGDTLTMEQFTTLPRANFYWPAHQRIGENLPEWLTDEDLPVRMTDRSHVLRLLMLPGTTLVALAYEKLIHSLEHMLDVRAVELPFTVQETQRGMAWHRRNSDDAAHRWLRDQIAEIAAEL